MKLGLGSYSYRWSIGMGDRKLQDPLTPLGLLLKAADHELALVQYAENIPLHLVAASEIQELAEAARFHSIEIELGIQGLSPETVETYAKLAEALNAKLLRLSLSASDAQKPDGQVLSELHSAAEACSNRGITLALENHFHTASATLKRLLEHANHPALGVCLDVGNSLAIHERPEETVALLAPFARNLHLKDYKVELDPYGVGFALVGTPLGQGQLDIDMVFAALRANSLDVNVVLEQWLPLTVPLERVQELEDDWVSQSVRVARQHVEAYRSD